jgi:hypothetical protein
MYPQAQTSGTMGSGSITGMTLAGPQPSVPEIHDVLQQQSQAVEKLHELINMLENKIEPVLMPHPPSTATKDAPERVYGSKVATQIAMHTGGVQSGLARLLSIIDRVAL